MKVSLLFILLAAINFSAPPAGLAQSQAKDADAFIMGHHAKRAQNPEGVVFTAAFKNNQKQFHQGEMLKLDLSYSSSTPNTYVLDTASYDRSGRLDIDDFVVDRSESVVDPLDDYFNSSLFGFIGGGLRGYPELTNKPEVITVELNEWMRFDKPGRYRLYVISNRVAKMKVKGDPFGGTGQATVSNVLEFEILPADKKWAAQKLNEAVTLLAKPDGDHRGACRVLRFLGTPQAATEMIKRFRGDDNSCDFEYEFGLIGSPQRDFVIREMEAALSSPEQPIVTSFISNLALLEFTRQTPAMPPFPAEGTDEQARQWQAQRKERVHALEQLEVNYLRQLFAAIPQKQPRARAAALQTLLDFAPQLNTEESAQARSLLASLSEVFTRLPLESQTRVLTYRWQAISSPAMIPVLRQLLQQPEKDRDQHEQKELRSIALARLFELSPDEGRRIILDEIRRATSRFDTKMLRSLPDETLPELDTVLATNLEESRGPKATTDTEMVSALIERYATDSILSRVRAVFDGPGVGKWACRIQNSLLAYFLRVDPETGADYLNKAIATRGEGFSHCYSMTLVEVAQLHMSREVEAAAITAVGDDDKEVVSDAARMLQDHGSADAEKALWQRLEKWSAAEKESRSNAAIEQSLIAALTHGRAWLSTPDKLKRLLALCRTDGGRHEVEQLISGWNSDIFIVLNAANGEPSTIMVAHYQINSVEMLKEKLSQYPSGTVFKWNVVAMEAATTRAKQIFDEVKSHVEQHGMKLERDSEVDQ
jgi:hypothetical protein